MKGASYGEHLKGSHKPAVADSLTLSSGSASNKTGLRDSSSAFSYHTCAGRGSRVHNAHTTGLEAVESDGLGLVDIVQRAG